MDYNPEPFWGLEGLAGETPKRREIQVIDRNGGTFRGVSYGNGQSRRRGQIEGEIEVMNVQWTERWCCSTTRV